MNKEKIIKAIRIINLLPLTGMGFVLFLGSGYTLLGIFESTSFRVIVIGYVVALIFGLLSFKKNYFLFLSLLGWIIFGLGNATNIKQTREENQKLCLELRANPTCVENECGFDCKDVGGGIGMTTSGSICKDKDMSLCQAKVKQDIKKESETQDVLKVYSSIVDKIIASPSPANENFENQLVAVYNCLEEKFGPGATGELKAIQLLQQKNLTAQQLDKYNLYNSSKGRNFAPGHLIAGLPNGDKNLSCNYINVK